MLGSIRESVSPDGRRLPLAPDRDRVGVDRSAIAAAWLRTPSAILGLVLCVAVLAIAVLADRIAPYDPFVPVGEALRPPSGAHPLGTDDLGRDLLSGIVYGIRTSLVVAGGVGAIALPLGILVGAVAGARGGLVDDALMRLTELWQVLPRFFLALMAIALFGPGLDRLIVVLGVTSWPLLARIVRAQVLSVREREFVVAARALGSGEWRILRRQLLPHALPAAIAYVTLLLAHVALIEASLAFVGLGDPDAMSLGYLAAQAQRFLRVAWWLFLFPGVALMAIVIGLNLAGDALNDGLRRR